MSDQICPNCRATVQRLLTAPSEDAYVNYYRCQRCGHVWTIAKDGSGQITHVTPLKSRAPDE